MMPPEELALLSAIHTDPRNDSLRLAYADWLERVNQAEYAEFIRLQCQHPYVPILYHPPSPPRVGHRFEMPWEDSQAKVRLERLLTLAPYAYRADTKFWEEHYLAPATGGATRQRHKLRSGIITCPNRLDLFLHTAHLAEWLAHPVMARADKLHIWPILPEDDKEGTMNSHYDAFWAENIPVLAASAVIDRLEELNPCGCISTGELTSRSVQNLALCRELLEPRVCVEYSY